MSAENAPEQVTERYHGGEHVSWQNSWAVYYPASSGSNKSCFGVAKSNMPKLTHPIDRKQHYWKCPGVTHSWVGTIMPSTGHAGFLTRI